MSGGPTRSCAELDQRWARTLPAQLVRDVVVAGVLGVAMDLWTRRTLVGREHVEALDGPVVFVATHGSHMDTPALLRALPRPLRHRTAVGAAADYFYRERRLALAVSLAFGTVPVRRDGGGLDEESSAHLDSLLAGGSSLVVFAEGTRSRDGTVGRLRSGASVLAARHGRPVVPVCLTGTHEAMPPGAGWMRLDRRGRLPRRRPVSISFGAPIDPAAHGSHREVMEAVRVHFARAGAHTTLGEEPEVPAPAPVAADRTA